MSPRPAAPHLARSRIDLDALRGLAALMVAAFHGLMWLRVAGDERLLMLPVWEPSTLQGTLVRALLALCNGAMAVDLFFVLSGFVLAASLAGMPVTPRTMLAFYVRRVLRLWPAYIASLALAAVYLGWFRGEFHPWPQASSWMSLFYRDSVWAADWAANLLLSSVALSPVAWTLRVEVVMSAFLPWLVWCARPLGGFMAILAIAAGFVVSPFHRHDEVGHYFYIFLIGAYGWMFRDSLAAALHRCRRLSVPVMPGCLCALWVPGFVTLEHHPLADLSMSLGAMGLILCLVEPTGGTVPALRRSGVWASLARLGTVSYSFYLCHFVVLYATAWAVLANVPQTMQASWPLPVMGAVLLVSLAPAIALASAVHRWVELPFMQLGRRLAHRLAEAGPQPKPRCESPSAGAHDRPMRAAARSSRSRRRPAGGTKS